MKKVSYIFIVAILFIGCRKEQISPNGSNQEAEFNLKVIPTNGLKVAEKISGIVICTVDEDILMDAIVDYYGAVQMKRMVAVELHAGQPNSFHVLRGRVRNGNQVTRYAFELTENVLANGTIELFLPAAGTEQHVTSPRHSGCKLKVTSVSTGYSTCGNWCQATYASTTSAVIADDFGTSKLISNILGLL